ncbi:MAG: hypothetical protein IJB41_02070 [Clostridia bacterium]|nr:hypothetical protein [Clostridia bacterium]
MLTRTRTLSVLCAAALLVMLVLQFVPYWNFATEAGDASCSINGYVWFPRQHEDLTAYLQSQLGADFTVDRVYAIPAIQLITGALGIAFALLKPALPVGEICACACGVAGLWGYLTNPALRLGGGWALHLLVSALVLVAGVLSIISYFKGAE